ncbi:hypothetical protein [Paraburkholderia phenoliruptrix]|uniref:hypothetical protein n=1 Tax=Paraburkholderia phenoliruptrix TaxID=252970 RepID=UPI003D981097
MDGLSDEERELQVANRYIEEAQQRIAILDERLQRERATGVSRPEAEKLLRIMRDVLETMIEHRRIVDEEVRSKHRWPLNDRH